MIGQDGATTITKNDDHSSFYDFCLDIGAWLEGNV
jgi:hypothetical protein